MISSWPRWLRSSNSSDVGFRVGKAPGGLALRWGPPLRAVTFGLCVLGCTPATPVLRQRGTAVEFGRVIPPNAYAHFMAGLRAESSNATEEARELYMAALRADPRAGAAWAGLVRTACSLPDGKVLDVLSAALGAADRPALPLVAFAQCKLKSKQPSAVREAERASHQALHYEPLLKQASWTLQASLAAQGRLTAAQRARNGYELYVGQTFAPSAPESQDLPARLPLSAIDRDLLGGDIAQARDAAAGQLTLGELSVRTWALGGAQAALEMAQQALVNEPDDPDAQLVLALAHRPPALENLTRLVHNQRTDVCALGLVLLAIELKRTQSGSAGHLLDELALDDVAHDDPLLKRWLREARR